MPKGFLLAIDQGTTNTKALLVDATGTAVFRASAPLALLQPQPGFVEQDPTALWQSVLDAIAPCIAFAKDASTPIEGIAISNQRETAVAWRPGKTPIPIGNAVSWQCRRSAGICDRLRPHHPYIQQITGLPVDPLASAGKWSWMLEHNPSLHKSAQQGEVHFGNVDAWLLANFTGGHVHATDHTNASRTALLDLAGLGWKSELLDLFQIPAATLPHINPSASNFGICTAIPELAGVPIVAMIGDSHAALFGHGSYTPGAVKATYGTGSSLMMLTQGLIANGASMARTIAWSFAGQVQYALEGNIAMTGSALQWVGDFLGLANPVDDAVALAASVPDSAGITFVPAMLGLGAPHWDTAARGSITNLARSHKAAHLARAAIDAIAFQVADVFFAMTEVSALSPSALRVDGGATANTALMQMQANLLDRPILRPENHELSALGAAWLGGITLNWWTLADLAQRSHTEHSFNPTFSLDQQYAAWKLAVARTRFNGGPA